ncbi:uncharacterized protein [Dermacentor andersoni]|uniref:uncharacterized protein n=1 Tax=Dermacentor andersoni TaxID=34620 RepID=UPI002417C8F7|nr:uncharacterized protein LOC129381177 [Dermacentor andersoni]
METSEKINFEVAELDLENRSRALSEWMSGQTHLSVVSAEREVVVHILLSLGVSVYQLLGSRKALCTLEFLENWIDEPEAEMLMCFSVVLRGLGRIHVDWLCRYLRDVNLTFTTQTSLAVTLLREIVKSSSHFSLIGGGSFSVPESVGVLARHAARLRASPSAQCTTHGDEYGIDASGFPGPRWMLTTSGPGNQARAAEPRGNGNISKICKMGPRSGRLQESAACLVRSCPSLCLSVNQLFSNVRCVRSILGHHPVDLDRSCTASAADGCCQLAELSVCNNFLWVITIIKLREGRLGPACLREPVVPLAFNMRRRHTFLLVRWRLKEHRSIEFLELLESRMSPKQFQLLDGAELSEHLRHARL